MTNTCKQVIKARCRALESKKVDVFAKMTSLSSRQYHRTSRCFMFHSSHSHKDIQCCCSFANLLRQNTDDTVMSFLINFTGNHSLSQLSQNNHVHSSTWCSPPSFYAVRIRGCPILYFGFQSSKVSQRAIPSKKTYPSWQLMLPLQFEHTFPVSSGRWNSPGSLYVLRLSGTWIVDYVYRGF